MVAAALLCVAPTWLLAQGIAPLQRIVEEACRCAARHEGGLDAALRCTAGPEEFGRYRVAWREKWTADQSAAATDLARIIETCIANAEDAASARERLGLVPVTDEGRPVPAYWRRVSPAEVARHPAKLVRIRTKARGAVKGLVRSADASTVLLSRARSDGGGSERIAYDAIVEAWVMELPSR